MYTNYITNFFGFLYTKSTLKILAGISYVRRDLPNVPFSWTVLRTKWLGNQIFCLTATLASM